MTDAEIVRDNFSLLRWIYGTHEALVEKVGGPSAWKKLSAYVLGNDKCISDTVREQTTIGHAVMFGESHCYM